LEKGELEKALQMAQEAEAQSKLAEQQAMDSKAAKPWLF
jgi:hypothetical protein